MPSVLDTANALISLADLKAYLSADTSDEFLTDTTNDNELELLINAASIYANQYTGVDLLSREHTEFYDGDGGDLLFLDNFPVTTAVGDIDLWIDSDRVYGDSTKIATTKIILYSALGKIIVEETALAFYPQSVKITYTAGYLLAAVPADLAQAIKLICSSYWKKKINKLTVVQSMTTAGQSITLQEDDIPTHATDTLDEYSRVK